MSQAFQYRLISYIASFLDGQYPALTQVILACQCANDGGELVQNVKGVGSLSKCFKGGNTDDPICLLW